ncbi:MAG: hypothetical protein ACXADY_26880 [Candidatus Hodarchaeales archaeon]
MSRVSKERKTKTDFQTPTILKMEFNFSLKNFFLIIILMNTIGFIGIVWNLANNANITPVTITGQIYSSLIMFIILQLIFFILYHLMVRFRNYNIGRNEK